MDLELWADHGWQLAGRLEAIGDLALGFRGKAALEYDYDYAMDQLGRGGSRALSCRYLPSFELWVEEPWPAFVFDLLPAGAARRSMLARLGVPDRREADWQLLVRAQYAPGNIRVRPTSEALPAEHPGFNRADVVERGPDFVEYAFERGAPVAGSTGAQGESPKFLLCEDHAGHWHADGAIPDSHVARHWLVKFPRGRYRSDQVILAEEQRYMELAREAGLRANAPLIHDDGCLFIERFDRVGAERLGLETIASLSGISAYGVNQPLQQRARIVAKYCSDPAEELRELWMRDVLDQALGNTDNHVRNTSVIKYPDGHVELSPIYDLAPMFLDRSGIPRASRWGEREDRGRVDWGGVFGDLEILGARAAMLRESARTIADFLRSLADRMRTLGSAEEIVERLAPRQNQLAGDLAEASRS